MATSRKNRKLGKIPAGMGLSACAKRDAARKRRWIAVSGNLIVSQDQDGTWVSGRIANYRTTGLVRAFDRAAQWAIAQALS